MIRSRCSWCAAPVPAARGCVTELHTHTHSTRLRHPATPLHMSCVAHHSHLAGACCLHAYMPFTPYIYMPCTSSTVCLHSACEGNNDEREQKGKGQSGGVLQRRRPSAAPPCAFVSGTDMGPPLSRLGTESPAGATACRGVARAPHGYSLHTQDQAPTGLAFPTALSRVL